MPITPLFHPFLGIQTPVSGYANEYVESMHRRFSTLFGTDNPIPILDDRRLTPDIPVSGLEEAEDRVLATLAVELAGLGSHFSQSYLDAVASGTLFVCGGLDSGPLPDLLQRQSHLIQARTGRGRATTVLVAPEDVGLLGDALTEVTPVRVGRWTHVGLVNKHLAVFTGPVPKVHWGMRAEPCLLVLRKGQGEFDALAYYSEHGDQGYLTWMSGGKNEDPDQFGMALDFAGMVTVLT